MLQSEFEDKVNVKVSVKEYQAIETVYMNSDLNKDDFCKMWVKMNQSRVNLVKVKARMEREEEEIDFMQYYG